MGGLGGNVISNMRPLLLCAAQLLLILQHVAFAAESDACEKCQCSSFCQGYDVVRIYGSTSCLVDCRGKSLTALPTAIPSNVEKFVLANNALATLPIGAFDQLTHLRHLDLSGNFLKQESLWSATAVPARGLFDKMERLEYLDLSTNLISSFETTATFQTPFRKMQPKATWASLAGATPTAGVGGGLRSLTFLDVSRNAQNDGPFPVTAILGLKETLQTFNAYAMSVVGALPTTIGQLTELTHLDISFGRLSGPLPTELNSLNKLTHLSVYSNRFQQGIPDLSANTDLVTLHLGQNELTGAIPHAQLKLLANLKNLYLHGNRLTGTVPGTTELPYTQYDSCYMAQNKFSCPLPTLAAGGNPCGLSGSGAGGCT